MLADPDAVEEALGATRAEVNRQVADITERADRDHQLTEAAQAAQASEAAHTEALATRDAETRDALQPWVATHRQARRTRAFPDESTTPSTRASLMSQREALRRLRPNHYRSNPLRTDGARYAR